MGQRGPRGRYNKPLTPKQLRVIDHFMVHDNKFAAVESEGWNGRGYADKFFKKPQVVAEIERRQKRMRDKQELTEDWVIQRLMKIADANLGNIMLKLQDSGYDLEELTEDERYVIEQFAEEFVTGDGEDETRKAKVSLPSKIQALTALARRLGLFTDNVNVTSDDDLVKILQSGRRRAGLDAAEEEE